MQNLKGEVQVNVMDVLALALALFLAVSPPGAVPPAELRQDVVHHRRQGEDWVRRREHPHPPLAGHGREAVGGDVGADAGRRGPHLQHQALPAAAARWGSLAPTWGQRALGSGLRVNL